MQVKEKDIITFNGQTYSAKDAPPMAIHQKTGRTMRSLRIEEKVNNKTATKTELYIEIERLKDKNKLEFFDKLYQDFMIDFHTACHLLHNS